MYIGLANWKISLISLKTETETLFVYRGGNVKHYDTSFNEIHLDQKEVLLRIKYISELINQLKPFCRPKELSFCHNLKVSNLNIFATLWCKPLLFQG